MSRTKDNVPSISRIVNLALDGYRSFLECYAVEPSKKARRPARPKAPTQKLPTRTRRM